MELDVGQLVLAILGLLGIGGAATEGTRRLARRRVARAPSEEGEVAAQESMLSKAEAKALADAAAASAAKDANVIATLDALRSSIAAHEHRDTERFTASEKRAAEQHGAIMGELARMAAEHDRVRAKVHDLAGDVAAHKIEIPHLRERIDDTRQLLNIDSGVRDVREIERREAERRRRG